MKLQKGDLWKAALALVLIFGSVAYVVITMRSRASSTRVTTPPSNVTAASVAAGPGGAPAPSPSGQGPGITEQKTDSGAEEAAPSAIGPPSSELKPGMKLVVKVVDPFALPPGARAAAAKPEPQSATPPKPVQRTVPPPLPPAVPQVANFGELIASQSGVQEPKGRPAGDVKQGIGAGREKTQPEPELPPSVACTIEGDEKVAILRTSGGRSVIARTGDKVDGYLIAAIRAGEVVLRDRSGGTRVVVVGEKPNGS